MSDTVKELRALAEQIRDNPEWTEDYPERALGILEIVSSTSLDDGVLDFVEKLIARDEASQQRIAALEAALRPFADFRYGISGEWGDGCVVTATANGKHNLTYGDYQRAAEALKSCD